MAEINVSNDNANEFEDETEVKSNAVTYREKSPFGRHFERIYRNTLVSLSELEIILNLLKFAFTPLAQEG